MGYEFSVRGWYAVPSGSPDLAHAAAIAFEKRPEWEHCKPEFLFCLLGATRNELAFGTESKTDAYSYLLFLRDVAALAPEGFGLVTITGEIMDGRDRIALCYGGNLRLVSRDETHASPWSDLLMACHEADYARVTDKSRPAEAFALPATHVARAWMALDWKQAAGMADLVARLESDVPELKDGVGAMNHMSEPHLLIASSAIEASRLTSALADLTRASAGAAGVVYFADGSAFHPFLVIAGSVSRCPTVSLRRTDGSERRLWNGRSFVGLNEPSDAWGDDFQLPKRRGGP